MAGEVKSRIPCLTELTEKEKKNPLLLGPKTLKVTDCGQVDYFVALERDKGLGSQPLG